MGAIDISLLPVMGAILVICSVLLMLQTGKSGAMVIHQQPLATRDSNL